MRSIDTVSGEGSVDRRPRRDLAVRRDIQALRAVAVGAVVLNHLRPEALPGGFLGVDVFFVVSGYLITLHLLRELPLGGRVALVPFWLKRVRRLLPAAILVAGVTVLGTLVLLPIAIWESSLLEAIASMIYLQNWWLVLTGADYFAADVVSPFTHYWSLSVEEQFYLIWPLALLAMIHLRRRGASWVGRGALVAFVGLVIWATWFSFAAPAAAYFDTGVRAWQFGAGALVAAAVTKRPDVVARVPFFVAWAGMLLLGASFLLAAGAMPLPGVVGILVVAGTSAVLLAGDRSSRWSVSRLLSGRPIILLGDISYSLYLWHWPLIVFYPFAMGRPLDAGGMLGVVALSVGLAYLTKRYVEDPVRRSPYLVSGPAIRHAGIVMVSLAVVLASLAGIGWSATSLSASRQDQLARSTSDCFGAASMVTTSSCADRHVLADPPAAALAAAEDLAMSVASGSVCLQTPLDPVVSTCSFGVPAEQASRVVALVGDSHAGHWIGALDVAAQERGWHVVQYMKSSCLGLVDGSVRPNWRADTAASCVDWSRRVSAELVQRDDIDHVLVSGITREYLEASPGGSTPVSTGTVAETWRPWLASGKSLVVLADTPRWGVQDVPTCVSTGGTDDPCAVPASEREGDVFVETARILDSSAISIVDMNDFFCDDALCHVAVGGLVAIGDGNHMTRTFSRSLAPYLSARLELAMGDLR